MKNVFETAPDEAAHQAVLRGLDEFNEAALREANRAPLRAFLSGEGGEIIAGAIGFSLEKWAFVDVLWVAPEQRGRGIGAALLREIESQAKTHGCASIFLDTFEFQARDFYLRHGFEILSTLPNEALLTRYFLFKKLT